MNHTEFIQALRSKRTLYAYVAINADCGIHIKQSKAEWLKIAKGLHLDSYDVVMTDTSIYIN